MNVKLIRQVQAFLTLKGYDADGELLIDGELGPCTRQALSSYQEDNDEFEITGEINEPTINQMYRAEVMYPKDAGWDVRLLQTALILHGSEESEQVQVDGEFNDATKLALIALVCEDGFYPEPELLY